MAPPLPGITPRESTPRKTLLRWFQTVLADKSVTNFSSDWNDGRNLAALVDFCKTGLIPDHASLDPSNGLENVAHAMSVAEVQFRIPQVCVCVCLHACVCAYVCMCVCGCGCTNSM